MLSGVGGNIVEVVLFSPKNRLLYKETNCSKGRGWGWGGTNCFLIEKINFGHVNIILYGNGLIQSLGQIREEVELSEK